MNMKTLLIVCICSTALAAGLLAQGASPATASPPAASISPAAGISPGGSPESELEKSIAKKHKKHFNFTIGDSDSEETTGNDSHHTIHTSGGDEIPEAVIPLVAISMFTIFGAPVLIVAVIMYFGFSKNRMMHKTVRMMVEKGQPVPPALLSPPPPAVRQRSDMRRGVVLLMIGAGLMIFLGACNDWDNGAWSLGIIPFLIGAGYLLVWKLEGKKDIPPPLP
jgi:hypothetical protein